MGNKGTERKKRQRQQRARPGPDRRQAAVLEGRLEASNKEYEQLVAERKEQDPRLVENHPGMGLTQEQINKNVARMEQLHDMVVDENLKNGTNNAIVFRVKPKA